MNESNARFSSAYRAALKLILVEQLPLGFLSGLMLDGGGMVVIFLYALIAFWAGFAMIVVRRPRTPTKVDMFFIKWGIFPLFALSVLMAGVIWRWRGAI